MSENLNLKTITTIDPSPFKHLCVTIGALPSTFLESMSYYELLAWFVNYLENTVIPAVNANGEATAELQELFIELKDFVDNYFENLDVQEEINNKLDEMAEQGTLQEIITTYIQSNVAWTFDTVADMKLATNLVAGSYAQTLGFHTINDGGGATYYIIDTGTANEMDVIAVGDLYANLVLPEIVTPEMFGAYGDGTHNDTNAWNAAASVKRSVKAFDKTYLTGKISVTDNIEIDCGNASFICSDDILFEFKGTKVTSLANENNYTRNDVDYTIVNADYASYTGLAFVHGDNNFQEDRENYLGGFIATFQNGKITTSYPIPVTNPQIDIIEPITAELRNINNITHQTVQDTVHSICIEYGMGCVLDNIKIKDAQGYADIDIDKSINVVLKNLTINHEVQFSDNVSYVVYLTDSSFCTIKESYLFNRYWHTVTTSGNYLCFRNKIDKCELYSSVKETFLDHGNALGTTIINSDLNSAYLFGMSTIRNCNIMPCREDAQKVCRIVLQPSSIKENGTYTVENITFNPDDSTSANYCGVWLYNAPVVSGKTYHYTNIKIRNCRCSGDIACNTFATTSDTTGTYYLHKIFVDSSDLEISFKRGNDNQWDITDFDLYVSNINYDIPNSGTPRKSDIGITNNDKFNNLYITNCYCRQIRGYATNASLNGVNTTSYIYLNVSGKLNGSNILNRIDPSVIYNASDVNISDMVYGTNDKWYNITSKSGTKYYEHIDTGAYTTVTLTV